MKRTLRALVYGLILAVALYEVPALAQSPQILELYKAITNGGRWGNPRYTTAARPPCNTSNLSAKIENTTTATEQRCNGSAWVDASAPATIPTGTSITGGGANAVLFESSTQTLAADATNFFWQTTANGNYLRLGAGTSPGAIRLLEGSGTGVNYGALTVPTSLTGDRTYTFPDFNIIVAGSTAALTSGRVPIAGASGLLTDDADLTFATDTLTATKIIGSTSITDTGLTATRVTFAGAAGILTDDSDMTFATDTLTITKIISSTSITEGTAGAGTAQTLLNNTLSGSSATSNGLSVTGTFPASLSAQTNMVAIIPTFVTQNQQQIGLRIATVASGGSNTTASAAGVFINAQQGSTSTMLGAFGTSTVQHGIYAEASASSSFGVGGHFLTNAGNGGNAGAGVIGESTITNNVGVGVWGNAANTSSNGAGGFFTLASGAALGASLGTVRAAVVIDNAATTGDILVARDNGTAVFTIADGGLSTFTQFVRQSSGELALNADYTNATAGFTNTTLSTTVTSGRTYSFTLVLLFQDSTAADGAQFDFNGGSAAATSFRAHCIADNAAGGTLVLTNAATTTLATAVQVALALTTQTQLVCNGTFVPSGSGTFIVRGAQTAHTTGTLTIDRGSWLNIRDANPL